MIAVSSAVLYFRFHSQLVVRVSCLSGFRHNPCACRPDGVSLKERRKAEDFSTTLNQGQINLHKTLAGPT